MKVFTSTELRTKSTEVYNAVMTDIFVKIQHRDRPLMVLMTAEQFRAAITRAESKGQEQKKQRLAQAST